MSISIPNTKYKSEVAREYGISLTTLKRWLIPFEAELKKQFDYNKDTQRFTPNQLNYIYEKLGRP